MKAATERHSKSAQAAAVVEQGLQDLAPVTPEKHDTAASLDMGLPPPATAVGRRLTALRTQPVMTRHMMAHVSKPNSKEGPAAAKAHPELDSQAGRGRHARVDVACTAATAGSPPAAGRVLLGGTATAVVGKQRQTAGTETLGTEGQQRDSMQERDEDGAQPAAGAVRVRANRELPMLHAASPTTALSSLFSREVATRRQRAEGPADAAQRHGNSRDRCRGTSVPQGMSACELTMPRRSKRSRGSDPVKRHAILARPQKKQRTEMLPAAGPAEAPASGGARATRLQAEQAHPPASVSPPHHALPQRGELAQEPLLSLAMTCKGSPAASRPRTSVKDRHSTAVEAQRRRTRSQSEACPVKSVVCLPSLHQPGIPASPRAARDTSAACHARHSRLAATNAKISDPATNYVTRGAEAAEQRVTSNRGRSEEAKKAAAPTAAPEAHGLATSCGAGTVPRKRGAIKRELAALLHGSASAPISKDLRSDALPAGLTLRNRCVAGRATAALEPLVAVDPAAAQAPAQPTATETPASLAILWQIKPATAAKHVAAAPPEGLAVLDGPAVGGGQADVAVGTAADAGMATLLTDMQQQNGITAKNGPDTTRLEETAALPEPAEPAGMMNQGNPAPSAVAAAAVQPKALPLQEPSQRASAAPSKKTRPLPLLPAPQPWGGRGLRSMDIAAAAATARGRTLRAVRPDYARLAATEAVAARLPVWPGPQMLVPFFVPKPEVRTRNS